MLLLTVEPKMKWYFPTNQEKYFFIFLARVPFNFEFFSISSIIKKTSVARLRGPHLFVFPFYGIKRAAALVTRSLVTLQVVVFWSRYRLFKNQTNLFIIEIDKKNIRTHILIEISLRQLYVFWTRPWWKRLTEGDELWRN